jgi:hypothetical protein
MEEIDALKGPPPKERVGIKNDSNASAIADLIADLSAGNAITSESSSDADAAAVIEKAMREIQARALANFEAQDEETQQKIQQLLDTLRQQYNTLLCQLTHALITRARAKVEVATSAAAAPSRVSRRFLRLPGVVAS